MKCDTFVVHLCHVCVRTASAYTSAGQLSLKQKGCLHICHQIGLHRLPTAHTPHIGSAAELLLLSLDSGPAASTHRTAAWRACLFLAKAGSTWDRVIQFLSFTCGVMASSAVSSVLYLRDAAGKHAETHSGAHIHYGDAARSHDWEFRTRLRVAGKTGDQYIEAVSKVVDGQRGDAFVAAQEVGFDDLCEIVDGRQGIDTLIQHVRGMVFPFD